MSKHCIHCNRIIKNEELSYCESCYNKLKTKGMFTENSQLVQTWVRLVKAGKYTKDQVPNISNLKEMVNKALEEG